MSEGGDIRGSWNSDENFDYVADPQPAVDGGDGLSKVTLSDKQNTHVENMAIRTQSDPTINPLTGTDLGKGIPKEQQ